MSCDITIGNQGRAVLS